MNGWCHGHPAALFFRIFKEREIRHPQEVEFVRVDDAALICHGKAQRASAANTVLFFASATTSSTSPVSAPAALCQRGLFLLGEELFKAGGHAVRRQARVGKAFGTIGFGHVHQLIDLLAGERAGKALCVDEAHAAARLNSGFKHCKPAFPQHIRHILQLQPEAVSGLSEP